MKHIEETCDGLNCYPAVGRCFICDGGLLSCTQCGGAESSLTTECRGVKLTSGELQKISSGKLDYKGGRWYTTRIEVAQPTTSGSRNLKEDYP